MSVRTPLLVGQNDLTTVDPSLAAQWHPVKNGDLLPSNFQAGSNKKVWWTCSVGHEFESRISNRSKLNNGCPICSGKQVLVGFNDLGAVMPDIAAQWDYDRNDGLTPKDVTTGSNKKVWWKCSLGHGWQALISNRKPGTGCVVCAGKTILAGFNDVATLYPQIMDRWDYDKNTVQPTEVGKSYAKKIHWKCDHGHVWTGLIFNEKNRQGCSFCSGKKLIAGVNDVATLSPHLAPEWNYAKNSVGPEAYKNTSNKKVWWTCSTCAHEWEAIITNRTYHKTGCPVCAGQRVSPGINDFASQNPELMKQWHPDNTVDPTKITSGNSGHLILWRCQTGHEWTSRVADRVRGTGCLVCHHEKLPGKSLSLADEFPMIARDWAQDLNGSRTPDTVASRSNKPFWWRCATNPNHVWGAPVANRTDKNSNCPICWQSQSTSRAEQKVHDLLVGLGEMVVSNDRSILGGMELDLYVPEKDFAVEYNGLYWHSEARGKDRTYHQKKAEKCAALGIELFQVWEDDWLERPEIVSRHIAYRLGKMDDLAVFHPELDPAFLERIHARKCAVETLDYRQAKEFLDLTHIQGAAKGTHYYGLTLDGDVRAVLVLAKSGKKNEWLINRYATKGIVRGGFTKVLAHAEKVLGYGRFVTFADRSISGGELYENTGFTAEAALPSDYSYVKNNRREHKFNYRLKRFRTDPELSYKEGLTEAELAELNGLNRIWDCGKVRYAKAFG